MKTLIDNTALHRIYMAIEGEDATKPVRQIDAIGLFHIAEHILFSEEIEVSYFEIDHIRETTSKILGILKNNDCITTTDGKEALKGTEFTIGQYAKACDAATPKILEDLSSLDQSSVKGWFKFADEATQPIGIRGSQLDKWVLEDRGKDERRAIASDALQRKASGSYDYVVGSNDALYGQIKAMASTYDSYYRKVALAAFLDPFFRVHINKELANIRGSIYSPAPQRATIIRKCDDLFRFGIEKRIIENIKEYTEGPASNFIKKLIEKEFVPLPMFAIHFLRRKKASSPIQILRAALELRENDSDLKAIRSWLSKWENLYVSNNLKKREKAHSELSYIAKILKPDKSRAKLTSILRGKATISPDGSFSYEPDFAGMGEAFSRLFSKLSRPQIFISCLRREFSFENSIGADIFNMLNRPIIE